MSLSDQVSCTNDLKHNNNNPCLAHLDSTPLATLPCFSVIPHVLPAALSTLMFVTNLCKASIHGLVWILEAIQRQELQPIYIYIYFFFFFDFVAFR